MSNQPSVDRGFLIPISIGSFAIVGICLALLIVYLDKPQATTSVNKTPTPFKYLLLATETPIPELESATVPALKFFPVKPVGSKTPEEGLPKSSTAMTSHVSDLVNSATPDLALTPTVGTNVASVLERYDDTDARLEYDGEWTGEIDVQDAHQGTLSVSTTIGSDVTFTFVGQQIIIGYMGNPGLGSILISIDDNEFLLNQSAGNAWFSPQFIQGEHFVILIHQSGNSVNLDYIDILDSS